MEIILNNRIEQIEETNLTVDKLLKIKNFTFKMLVVKINNSLVKKDDYKQATINAGDKVSVLHMISGG